MLNVYYGHAPPPAGVIRKVVNGGLWLPQQSVASYAKSHRKYINNFLGDKNLIIARKMKIVTPFATEHNATFLYI